MEDQHGHRISYLRVSITDRCNERCAYCLPAEFQEWLPRDEVLSYEEILRVLRVGTGLGIDRVRVTGGEPLVRRGVYDFFRKLAEIEAIRDIGVSTNGTLLASRPPGENQTAAEILRDCRVRSVNISLDSLDREAYRRSTGRDYLEKVLEGIAAVRACRFEALKLNCVLMRDGNEEELPALVRFAGEQEATIRFIELMPVTTRDVLHERSFLSVHEAMRRIAGECGELAPAPELRGNGPAVYFRLPHGQKIGFIGAMTNLHFCESCNKLRLTCDGKLRPCLGSWLEFDLKEVLRRPDTTDAAVAAFFREVVERKPKEHDFRGAYEPQRHMTAIGG
ncbi:MAG TPA: GTP 3',8-cyclase MoaA [Verrucomicrobiales bacterium]|nr:GTP 3',8-cyclase MoaA [Verrucomicrobiales bacterium]